MVVLTGTHNCKACTHEAVCALKEKFNSYKSQIKPYDSCDFEVIVTCKHFEEEKFLR